MLGCHVLGLGESAYCQCSKKEDELANSLDFRGFSKTHLQSPEWVVLQLVAKGRVSMKIPHPSIALSNRGILLAPQLHSKPCQCVCLPDILHPALPLLSLEDSPAGGMELGIIQLSVCWKPG